MHLSTTGPVSAALTGLPLTGLPRPVLVGFVVPKAVGNAVVRNRVRRRLRALLATRLAALPPQASVVVRVTPAAAHASTATLAADLDVGLGRAVAGVRRSGAAAP